MGLVHHSRYWVYFELGRTELLRNMGLAYRDLEEAGTFLVVARCSARFRAPARYDDLLTLTTTQEKIAAVRIDHSYQLNHNGDGKLVATGRTTLACVDGDGRVTSMPDTVIQRLSRPPDGREAAP